MQEKIKKIVEDFNQYEYIKKEDNKQLLVFKSDSVFNVFGGSDKCLDPWNNYTYTWLSGFFDDIVYNIDSLDCTNLDKFKDSVIECMNEWIDSQVDMYTKDLFMWLSDNVGNMEYTDDVINEGSIKSTSELIQHAQYRAIDELYNTALNILCDYIEALEDD